MDDIHLEFDKKTNFKTESPESPSNERTQLKNLPLRNKEKIVLSAETANIQTNEVKDEPKTNPSQCNRQRIIIASVVVALIVISLTAIVIVITITTRGQSRTVSTTVPPTTTEPVPDFICRNETVATGVMINCFNFIAFLLMETDVEKCSYLDLAGKCVLNKIEDTYKVNCTIEDQLAVLEANSQQVNDFLQFNITAQCPDLFG